MNPNDESMIVAQGGEGILSRTGMTALARTNLNALNAGASGGGQNHNYYIMTNDARSFVDSLKKNEAFIHHSVGEAVRDNAELRRMIRESL